MKVLLALASHETQHVGSLRTAYRIKTREGDQLQDEWRFRGDVARESFVDYFLKAPQFGADDAILLLDADQRHPEDMLEKLREHDLDMVCAHYYARQTNPVQSLCYELGDGRWPYLPMLHPPKEGLHEIAFTGFGCVLIKKKVLQAVGATQPEGMSPIDIGALPEIDGNHMAWGPDFIFFHKARQLGYHLWLDASIESLHGITVWLGHESARKLINYGDWANLTQDLLEKRLELFGSPMTPEPYRQRLRILEARVLGMEQEARAAGEAGNEAEWTSKSLAVYEMHGRIKELQAWIDWAEKYPAIERPEDLPTTMSMPAGEPVPDDIQAERTQAYQDNSAELIAQLPDVPKNGTHPQGHHA